MGKEKGDKMKQRERKWKKASGLAGPGGLQKCENGRRDTGKDRRIRKGWGGREGGSEARRWQTTAAPEKELKCEEAGERGEMKGKIRCYCSQRWGDRSVLHAPPPTTAACPECSEGVGVRGEGGEKKYSICRFRVMTMNGRNPCRLAPARDCVCVRVCLCGARGWIRAQ